MISDETRIRTVGRIVSTTGAIEQALGALGATGNGLREKVDSLGPALPAEAKRLAILIGNVRNRAAHDPDAEISPDEIALFEVAAEEFLALLNPPAPPAPAERRPQPEPAAAPTAKPEQRSAAPDSLLLAGRIPVLHLVYALALAGRAVGSASLPLAMLILEPAAIGLLIAGAAGHGAVLPLAAGVALLLAVWLFGVLDGRRQPADDPARLPTLLYAAPFLNYGYFVLRLLRLADWTLLFEALTVPAIWAGAMFLAFRGEYLAGAFLALLSYAGALLLQYRHLRATE